MGSVPKEDLYRPGMAIYAGPSLSQPHFARQAVRDAHEGKIPPLIGYFAAISSVATTRIIAQMGFDCAFIDWAHSPCDRETMNTMVHDLMHDSGGRTIPFVRIPGHDHATIGYALDAGASIIIPQIETVEEAQCVVSSCKFGTARCGRRSAPPYRLFSGLSDQPFDPSSSLFECLNDQAAIMIQIETLAGVNNLDAILTQVKDIDLVFLGSLDVRVSMGLPRAPPGGKEEPEWLAAKKKFLDVCKKHDQPIAGQCSAAVDQLSEEAKNFAVVFAAVDVQAIIGGMMKRLGECRQVIGRKK